MKLHWWEIGLFLFQLGAAPFSGTHLFLCGQNPFPLKPQLSSPFYFIIQMPWRHLLPSGQSIFWEFLSFLLRSQLASGAFPTAGVWDCSLDMDLGNQPCFSRGLELDDPQRSCPTTTILLCCDVSHMLQHLVLWVFWSNYRGSSFLGPSFTSWQWNSTISVG